MPFHLVLVKNDPPPLRELPKRPKEPSFANELFRGLCIGSFFVLLVLVAVGIKDMLGVPLI